MYTHMKRTLSLLVCIALVLSLLPLGVLAAGASMELTVVPSATNVELGSVVTFEVYGKGTGITALQFNLSIPEGMSYIPGSAAVPEGLKEALGWPATDWTEGTMIWTGYTADPTVFPEGTLLLSFSCSMDAEGAFQPELTNAQAFNAEYTHADLSVRGTSVLVTDWAPEVPPSDPDSSWLNLSIRASTGTAYAGDSITFSIYGHGENICAMQFNLGIPEGLVYTTGSGALPEGLRSQLGISGGLDWTDKELLFTMFNDVPIDIPEETLLLTFTCTAELSGDAEKTITLTDCMFFDGETECEATDCVGWQKECTGTV